MLRGVLICAPSGGKSCKNGGGNFVQPGQGSRDQEESAAQVRLLSRFFPVSVFDIGL
jgi:hypothetical protein